MNVSRSTFNPGISAAGAYAQGAVALGKGDHVVRYNINRPYRSVFLFEAKRIVLAEAVKALYSIVPAIIKNAQRKRLKKRDTALEKANTEIIKNGRSVIADFGYIVTSDGQTITALDIFGRIVETALIISYTGKAAVKYEMVFGRNGVDGSTTKTNILGAKKTTVQSTSSEVKEVSSVDIVAIDLIPKIECSSSKNVEITQVQGRDYSRKEIIGNGDVRFTVSGKFVSRNPDVYPQDQVSRFIDIMRHNGIVKVKNLLFSQHNVENIIIQDYSLPQPDCLNEQPYSFTCVGVEPDEEITARDTLNAVQYAAATDALDGWYNNILLRKLIEQGEAAASSGLNALNDSINQMFKSI